jgi:ribosomal protein S18 acetylase RimI-like enzyme
MVVGPRDRATTGYPANAEKSMSKKEQDSIRFGKVSNEDDLKTVEFLARIIWEEHYTPIIGQEQVEYMLGKYQSVGAIRRQVVEGMEYYLILHDEAHAGYLAVQVKEDALFLSKIYVLKEKRGQGVGRRAMEFVESRAKDLGQGALSLTVNKNNEASIRAYKNMGFVNLGPLETDIGGGFIMDDYVMRKEL